MKISPSMSGLNTRKTPWQSRPTTEAQQIRVEPALPEDAAELSKIHEQSFGEPLDVAEQLKLSHASLLKATAGATPLGFVVLHFGSEALTDQPTTILGSLCVSEEARGKGIGKALTAGALEYARKEEMPHVHLAVFSNNAPARGIYEEMGFKRENFPDGSMEANFGQDDPGYLYKFTFGDTSSEQALRATTDELRNRVSAYPSSFYESGVAV